MAAATTAGWAALVVAAPLAALALIVWVAESRSGAPAMDAVRIAADGWLVAHGATLRTADGPFRFVPLLLTVVILRQICRAGRLCARATGATTWMDAVRVAVAVGLAYGTIGVLAALLGATASVRVDLLTAGFVTAALAVASAWWGAVRAIGLTGTPPLRLPAAVRTGFQAGAVAALVVLAGGLLTVGVRLIVAAHQVTELAAGLRTGTIGGIGLLLLCVAYAPTAGVWATAYLIGPGFAVGVGSTVDASTVSLEPLPAFPLLAAVPTGPSTAMASLILGIPLVAGLIGGVLAARPKDLPDATGGLRRIPVRWRTALGAALLSGPVAGLLTGLAAAAARGNLGDGRLATVGPSPLQVGIVLMVEVSVSALVGATVARTVTSFTALTALRSRAPRWSVPPWLHRATQLQRATQLRAILERAWLKTRRRVAAGDASPAVTEDPESGPATAENAADDVPPAPAAGDTDGGARDQ